MYLIVAAHGIGLFCGCFGVVDRDIHSAYIECLSGNYRIWEWLIWQNSKPIRLGYWFGFLEKRWPDGMVLKVANPAYIENNKEHYKASKFAAIIKHVCLNGRSHTCQRDLSGAIQQFFRVRNVNFGGQNQG